MPGLSAGLFRLIWMVLPPILGTRKMVSITSLLLIASTLGWGVRVQSPDAPYWELMTLAFLAGIGGGAFSGFMPSTSYFFPKSKQGVALGVQAGLGNFGVSLVQLLTPFLIGFSALAIFGGSQQLAVTGTEPQEVWYQNAAFVWIPLMVIGAILAWTMLKSVPVTANVRQQFDIFKNQDTWWMTLLYIMTFGTFSGLAAQFGLLMNNLYGAGNEGIVTGAGATATLLVDGYAVPDPVKFVFLGPLVGAAARVLFSPLTDRMGGAVWTLISGIGLIVSISFTIPALTPDLSSAEAPGRGLQPVPVGHAGDLPVLRDWQRVHLQADADDLRAASSRGCDRLDSRDRRFRARSSSGSVSRPWVRPRSMPSGSPGRSCAPP